MLFNVSQLMRESTGAERTYTIDESLPSLDGDVLPSRITGKVRLVRTHRGLIAYASLGGVARESCSRCLGPVEMPVQATVEEEFLPTVDVNTGAPLPLPEGEDLFLIDEHHHVDLTEAVRQALVVEQPMQPLCRVDCAGLCPRCGADLNEGACACAEEAVDPRWAALSGFATVGDPAPAGETAGREAEPAAAVGVRRPRSGRTRSVSEPQPRLS